MPSNNTYEQERELSSLNPAQLCQDYIEYKSRKLSPTRIIEDKEKKDRTYRFK